MSGDAMTVMLPSGAEVEITVPDGCAAGSVIAVDASEIEAPAAQQNNRVEVTVPDGVAEGEDFSVQLADDTVISVSLPPGYSPGDTLEVEVPMTALPNIAEPPDMPKSPPKSDAPTAEPAATAPKKVPVTPAFDQQAAAALAQMCSSICAACSSSASSSSAAAAAAASSPFIDPRSSRCGGSRFNDRFSPSRHGQQQAFVSSSPGASPMKQAPGKSSAAPETITFRSDQLSEPEPDEGCRFYPGQPVQLLRASGEWTEGTILELPMPGLLETVYRCASAGGRTRTSSHCCKQPPLQAATAASRATLADSRHEFDHARCAGRLGEGLLEKMVGEDGVRWPTPDPGFAYHRGQVVQAVRPNGLQELATVVRTSLLDRTGSGVKARSMSECTRSLTLHTSYSYLLHFHFPPFSHLRRRGTRSASTPPSSTTLRAAGWRRCTRRSCSRRARRWAATSIQWFNMRTPRATLCYACYAHATHCHCCC